MRVIEISEFGGPEVLKLADRVKPEPADGQVLIKVAAAGVNRPDIVQRQGFYPAPKGASDLPGLEVAGVIEAIGKGVSDYVVGQKVCALLTGGGYADYAVADQECVLPIPNGMDFTVAAAIPETYFTVWSNLFQRANMQKGESLLVHGGSSGIGTTAIQLGKALGLTVYATAGNDDKCAFCRDLGADHAINYKTEAFEDGIMDITNGRGVDGVLDMVGGDYVNRNISCMAPDARHVTIAFLKGQKVEINMVPVMLKRLTLTGSTLRARDKAFKGKIAQELQATIWPLMENGKCHPVIDSVYPVEQAVDAHTLMESSTHKGKIILSF